MTNDLISRGKLLEKFTELKEKAPTLRDAVYLDGVMAVIDAQSVVDAVEVVRCCDCKYSVVPCVDSEGNVVCLYCQHPRRDDDGLSMTVDFVDFCSQGKRRESEGE